MTQEIFKRYEKKYMLTQKQYDALMPALERQMDTDHYGEYTISNLVKNKTVLIIAHRMRTVAGADRIVVLKDGYVAEQGTPEELLEKKGIYHHMAELQGKSLNWSL